MATDCFKFWDSYYEALKMVPTPEQGYRLVMALCAHVFEDADPDFSDDPLLGMVYTIMDGQAIQSRDLSRAGRENGRKAKGVPKQRGSKGGLKGSKSEKKRSEEKRSYASSIEEATPAPNAFPAPPDGGPDAPSRYDDDQYPTAPTPPEP